jgi:hypothetical protein
LQHVELGRFGARAVGVAHELEQLTRLVENRAAALAPDDLLQHRDCEMRLADAGFAGQQQPALGDRKLVDELQRLAMRRALAVGVCLEVGELAVQVSPRDARVLQQRVVQLLMPALAA